MSDFPKILVTGPTASLKNYCFDDWIENTLNFKYPNYDVRLFDNTNDEGKNAELLNKKVREKYGSFGEKFKAYNSLVLNKAKVTDTAAKMAISHNDCRNYFLNGKYKYMLHIETDVFPPDNIIESLMFNKKKIVGALYYREMGRDRSLMIQKMIKIAPNEGLSTNFKPKDDSLFVNGEVKQVTSVGLGCVLIDRGTMKKIKFRSVKNNFKQPDAYFSQDCYENNIKIFADTSIIARHENQLWGIYGLDYK